MWWKHSRPSPRMSGDSLPVNVEGGDVITRTACSQEIARIMSYGEHCFAVLYLKSLSTEPVSSVFSNWLFSFPVYSMEICCKVQLLFGIFSEFWWRSKTDYFWADKKCWRNSSPKYEHLLMIYSHLWHPTKDVRQNVGASVSHATKQSTT